MSNHIADLHIYTHEKQWHRIKTTKQRHLKKNTFAPINVSNIIINSPNYYTNANQLIFGTIESLYVTNCRYCFLKIYILMYFFYYIYIFII